MDSVTGSSPLFRVGLPSDLFRGRWIPDLDKILFRIVQAHLLKK